MPVLSETLVERDGSAYILSIDTAYFEPERMKSWFLVGTPLSRIRADLIGLPVHNVNAAGGYFSIDYPVGYRGQRETLRLANGGNTTPSFFEREAVPPPKVRKGTEVRWHRGRWEKLTKREGWVVA